jgi:anti-anti-sigma factor
MLGSTILGMIVSINRGLRQRGGQLRLVNVGPGVEDCFRVSRLDALLAIHATEDEAWRAFE